jgi:hypothetical protein
MVRPLFSRVQLRDSTWQQAYSTVCTDYALYTLRIVTCALILSGKDDDYLPTGTLGSLASFLFLFYFRLHLLEMVSSPHMEYRARISQAYLNIKEYILGTHCAYVV